MWRESSVNVIQHFGISMGLNLDPGNSKDCGQAGGLATQLKVQASICSSHFAVASRNQSSISLTINLIQHLQQHLIPTVHTIVTARMTSSPCYCLRSLLLILTNTKDASRFAQRRRLVNAAQYVNQSALEIPADDESNALFIGDQDEDSENEIPARPPKGKDIEMADADEDEEDGDEGDDEECVPTHLTYCNRVLT